MPLFEFRSKTRDEETVASSIDVDDDLNKVWANAIKDFERITNTSLPVGQSNKFVGIREQMCGTINKSQSKNRALAQQVLDKSMTVLQNFGGILASSTSAAFPATGQCWNAISMVIGAAQSYHKILDGFVTLLERCLAFLEQLCFFLDKKKKEGDTFLDRHIREPAYDIIAQFLRVLAFSYKLSRSKCQKLRVFLEIFLFNDDAGLANHLNQFEENVRLLTNRKVDVILKDVKGLARYMAASDEERDRNLEEIKNAQNRTIATVGRIEATAQDIKSAQDREFVKNEGKEKLEMIRNKLDIGLDQTPWREQQRKIGLIRAPNTGIWLLERNERFRSWTDVRAKAVVAAIALVGGSGYGKSFLFSHVISYLLDTYNQSDHSDRVFVAYYFWGNEQQTSLGTCLRSLMYQLASEDAEFREHLAKDWGKDGQLPQAGDVWKLMASGPLKTLKGRTYFLCIDGYRNSKENPRDDEVMVEIVRSTMRKEHNVTLRLFISTESKDLDRIRDDSGLGPLPITLGLPQKAITSRSQSGAFDVHADGTSSDGRLPNEDDLLEFARFRIENLCKTKPDLSKLLGSIEFDVPKRLAIAARGYYPNLDSKLRQINVCESEEKVKDIINRTDSDMETTLKESIKSLNASLVEDDIEHLNEMLVWVIGGRSPIHVDLLQAALYLAVGQNFMLRTLIDVKYSTLLKIDRNDFVVLQSDDLKPILQAAGTSLSEAQFSESENKNLLHTSEIDLVDRFVRNVCGDDLYSRFDFSFFFNVKRGKKETSIGVGSQDSLNIRILNRCLTALSTRKDTDRLAKLREYAATQWFRHMKDVKDFSEADNGLLHAMRSKIVALLSDRKTIETWWDPIRWKSQRELCENSTSLLSSTASVSNRGSASGTSSTSSTSSSTSSTSSASSISSTISSRNSAASGRGSSYADFLMTFLKAEDTAASYSEPVDAEWVKSIARQDGTRQHIFYHLALHLAHKWFSIGYHLDESFSAELFSLPYNMMKTEFNYDKSRHEVVNFKAFMLWARKHIRTQIDEPYWKYAEGGTFLANRHPREALDAFRVAMDLIPDMHDLWPIPGYMAAAHSALGEYSEALEKNTKCRELKSRLVETERGRKDGSNYLEEYWNSYLLDAEIYRKRGDLEIAATCYQKVIKGDVFWNSSYGLDMHEYAAQNLFAYWNTQEDHASILEMLQTWRQSVEGTNGIRYWLLKMGTNSDFHSSISSATIRTGQHQEVIEMYRYVLDQALDAHKNDNFNKLYYYYASLLYYASPNEEDHDAAIEYWKDLLSILHKKEESAAIINLDALPAIVQRSLCNALIEEAVSKTTRHLFWGVKYTNELRNLVTSDEYSFPQLQNTPQDPRIALAMLLNMQGESDEAHSVAQTMLRSIFETWPDAEDEVDNRYTTLRRLLSAIGDNNDAVAAWYVDTESVTCQNCFEDWPDVTIYLCKQCLAQWLCSDCHSSVLSDALTPGKCSKKHSFIEISECGSSDREDIGDGMVKVGDSIMARKDWLDALRTRWNVTKEQLKAEARASVVIGRSVLRWNESRKHGQRGASHEY